MNFAQMEASFEFNRPWVYSASSMIFFDEKSMMVWLSLVLAVRVLSKPEYLGVRKPVNMQ